MKILLDTDVLIDIEKGVSELPEGDLYISIISLYEFIRGRSDYIEVKDVLEDLFTIIPIDNNVLIKATEIWRKLKKQGDLIDDRDLLIGATAISNKIPLLTKNTEHFKRLLNFGLNFYENI
ncbi:MAG: type II toxin-antitoxin system VapC family toxin [archaeon GB-1867-035]|nr:type II toxin-antitoxin system VapC family toxin [Candidatus Culexmicrobium profundum]